MRKKKFQQYDDDRNGRRVTEEGRDLLKPSRGCRQSATTGERPLLCRFFCFQCSLAAFVTLASHVRFLQSSKISIVAKYLTPLGAGLPNGLNSRAATRIGTS